MKLSTHNADGSTRYTPRGRHWNDGPDPNGPVRTLAVAAAVHRMELDQAQAQLRARPPRPVGRLSWRDAEPWPSLRPVPRSVRRRMIRVRLEPAAARPDPGLLHVQLQRPAHEAYRARVAALLARRPVVIGV